MTEPAPAASADFWDTLTAALEAVDPAATVPPPDGRVGAVLVLLEDGPEGPTFVLTRRRRDLRSHPGQLSFPGGRREDGETVEEAALREAHEEIGLREGTVSIVGVGPTFFIPPSKFWVVPVVARWDEPHEVDPSPWEVDEVLHVPLATLLERDRWRHVPLSLRGSTWAWQLDDDLLWGATAMIIALLLEVVRPGWSGGLAPEQLEDDLAVRPWEDTPGIIRKVRLEGDLPAVPQESVPHVTLRQMRAVDEELAARGLRLEQLVEQAGRGLAHATRRLIGADVRGIGVTVLAGSGGNGAGGLSAARLLAAAGAEVEVVLTGRPTLSFQAQLLRSAGVAVVEVTDEGPPPELVVRDVVLDAMLGIGAEPPLRGRVEATLAWLRRHGAPVVALDLPSGIHADRGLVGPCVTADVTVTIAAPKQGLLPPITHPYVGDLYVADLGVPADVWEAAGVEPVEIFGAGPLVRLVLDEVAHDAATPDQAVLDGGAGGS